MRQSRGEWLRVVIFCLMAFAMAGATALVIFASGGLTGSRALVPGTPLTVAAVLLPTAYMFSPAVANLVTRLVTREGWSDLWLRPRFDPGWWRVLLVAWLLPVLLCASGALLFYVIFPSSSTHPCRRCETSSLRRRARSDSASR